MELAKIEKIYPKFVTWYKKEKKYLMADGISLIVLWYEYIETHGIK